jgi:hypothetical protein
MIQRDTSPTRADSAARRFLRDHPDWLDVVRACVVEATRCRGEFAGAWVLREAKKSGRDWLPNLRPLVACGILQRTDVARGGRRAYYVMPDIEGVKTALMDVERQLNEAATEALANAMYRYTFGIIGDGKGGSPRRSLGTGVGVYWQGCYLIVTAAHTMEGTPDERVSFLLPDTSLVVESSGVSTEHQAVRVRKAFQLENPQPLLAENGEDLAAFLLEQQMQEEGRSHFYQVDESNVAPATVTQVGLLGYAGVTRMSIGANFMATPYVTFGDMMNRPPGQYGAQMSITYPVPQNVDPHGLSGSGAWTQIEKVDGIIWTPRISLVGLVTQYDSAGQLLTGYRIEEIVQFLKTKEEWIRPKPK